VRLKLAAAVLLGAVMITTPALTQQDRKPNLYVSSIGEPPDVLVVGDDLLVPFTVSNEGPGVADASILRAYLSSGRGRGSGDRRLSGQRRVPGLRSGAQHTGRRLFRVPSGVPEGTYYLVVCADAARTVDETNDRNNCIYSGQRVSIVTTPPATGVPGPPGAEGPPGAKGPAGPAGAAPDFRRLPRVELSPPETETAEQDVLNVGPFTFRYECENADSTNQDFARINVLSTSQTLTVQRPIEEGQQLDVPPGTEARLIEARRDQGSSPIPDDPGTPNDDESADSQATEAGFKGGRMYVTAHDGTDVIVEAWAAVDSNGVGEPGPDNSDECVFAGRVIVP
jgi:hypothetical protein